MIPNNMLLITQIADDILCEMYIIPLVRIG